MSCPSCARGQTSNAALLQRVVLRKHRGTAVCRPSQTVEKPLWGGLEGRSPPKTIRTRRHVRRVRKPCAARFPCTFPRPRPRRRGNVSWRKRPAAPAFFDKLRGTAVCRPSKKFLSHRSILPRVAGSQPAAAPAAGPSGFFLRAGAAQARRAGKRPASAAAQAVMGPLPSPAYGCSPGACGAGEHISGQAAQRSRFGAARPVSPDRPV